jgi:hypothetical protein
VELTVAEARQIEQIVYEAINWIQQWHKLPSAK